MRLPPLIRDFLDSLKVSSTEVVEFELRELENAFALLLLGALVGAPSPPSFLAFRLLPLMEREITVMLRRAQSLDDIEAQILGLFSFG